MPLLTELGKSQKEDQAFMIEMLEELLVEVREGRVRQLITMWETREGLCKQSRVSYNSLQLIGLIEFSKLRCIDELRRG